jgi:hypothetical protein
LLSGINKTRDEYEKWDAVVIKVREKVGKGRIDIESAVLSPDSRYLAVSAKVQIRIGFFTKCTLHSGLVFSIGDHSVVGKVSQGLRMDEGWSEVNG